MITKLPIKDFMLATRRWLERHPEVEPMSRIALFQCVTADCYPAETYEHLMQVIAETEAGSRIENEIRDEGSDPDRWDFCGIQGELFKGDEARSPKKYLLPDGSVAGRGQVSVVYGMQSKIKVLNGIRKKLDAVQMAIDLDAHIIKKATDFGIDPETVNYAPCEEETTSAERVA